jgi:hypothetical protein
MIRLQPTHMVLIGVMLMLLGWVLPFLMVLHVIKSNFALNFFSYAAQISGLFLGIIGVATYIRVKKK